MTKKLEDENTIAEMTKKLIANRLLGMRDLLEKANLNSAVNQLFLREAIRIAYYASFQTICRICTEAFCESNVETTKPEDWLKIFRSFDHKDLRNKLNAIKQAKHKKYPVEIENLATYFSKLQDERMKADYDPSPYSLNYDDAVKLIWNTLSASIGLNNLSLKDKRSLAISLLFKDRP